VKSIRVDLTARLLAGIGLTVIGVSLGSYLLVRRAVSEDFDASLAGKARAMGALVSFDEGAFEFDLAEQAAQEFMDRPEPEYFEIWLEDGTLVARSPSLKGGHLPRQAGALDAPRLWDQRLADERPGRAVGLLLQGHNDDGKPLAGAGAPRVLIVLARSRAPLDRTLAGVALTFGAGCLLTLLVVVGVVQSSVRRALRPVAQLSERIDAIDAATLGQRVAEDGVPRELAFIAPRLNALLERLQQAFERERRMTSNVAHELRTPLAELRTAAEVAQRWSDDEALRDAALATAHDVSLRMGDLVNALLRLSRVASGQARLARDDVAVAATVAEWWKPVSDAARGRQQALHVEVPPDLVLSTDRDLLGVALGNLLGNAVQYGASGQPIACRAAPGDRGVRLTVANEAEGLQVEDLPHLTEPFWRADRARTGGPHVGLGLSLVEAVAEALGARLSFDLVGTRFQAHLDFPR